MVDSGSVRSMIKNQSLKSLAPILRALSVSIFIGSTTSPQSTNPPKSFNLQNSRWQVRIAPAQLGLWGKPSGVVQEITLALPTAQAEQIAGLKVSKNSLSWRVPRRELTVEVRLSESELSIRVTTTREQTLEWPTTGADQHAVAAIFPEGEGLYIPVTDPFWRTMRDRTQGLCRNTWGGISMPFWGFQFERATIAYILPDDLRSEVCLGDSQGRLFLNASHQFLKRDGLPPYEMRIVLTENSPIGPALAYRKWLIKTGRFVSFANKTKLTPEASKLLGAMHGYLLGNGRTLAVVNRLHQLGVDRACLIYEQDPRERERDSTYLTPEVIARAREIGYLIGPYDTFNNIQDPQKADCFEAVYDDELYQTGGVLKSDGTRHPGFRGRGYHLSSEALKRAKRHFIEERVNFYLQAGINSYFIDVDATGELYDDFDEHHPMTIATDRANRLQRMEFVSRQKRLVLGSESAVAWSTPAIHFSHGTLTPKSYLLWQTLRNRERLGGAWPRGRSPRFMTYDAPSDFAMFTFDPRYRLPLFETVFHDSVISLDFVGVPLMKFTNLVQTRSLLLLLYNVPSLWSLDQKAIADYGTRIKAMNDFFAPIHRRIGDKPLTRFEWITPDRMVQQTQFANEIVMTANFSDRIFNGIPPRCIEARRLQEGNKNLYCPEP
jgi:Glycosyl hydrolases related to GH101 family, GH129